MNCLAVRAILRAQVIALRAIGQAELAASTEDALELLEEDARDRERERLRSKKRRATGGRSAALSLSSFGSNQREQEGERERDVDAPPESETRIVAAKTSEDARVCVTPLSPAEASKGPALTPEFVAIAVELGIEDVPRVFAAFFGFVEETGIPPPKWRGRWRRWCANERPRATPQKSEPRQLPIDWAARERDDDEREEALRREAAPPPPEILRLASCGPPRKLEPKGDDHEQLAGTARRCVY